MPDAITVEGSDLGVGWTATIMWTDVDVFSLEIRTEQPRSHQARFMTATPFPTGPGDEIFSTWPDGDTGPRWVIVVLSEAVRNMVLRDGGVERLISPVRIGASRLPQIGTFSVSNHPAHLYLYGEGGEKIGTLRLDDPRYRRDGQPRDLTAPAPIGPVTRILGR